MEDFWRTKEEPIRELKVGEMEGTRLRGARIHGESLDFVNETCLSEDGPAIVLPVQFDATAGTSACSIEVLPMNNERLG